MTFQSRKLAGMLGWTAGVSVATAVAGVPAAAADIEVVVTGSNIKRILSEGALPVQTITREEITKSGAQTAYEILEHVSAVMAYGGFNEALSARQGAATGFAGVSLRGLGIDKTLILLNGRRIANYALARSFPGVDLNSIPMAVIDRVEILLDGASAIYGADAVAGVINFITRKDFSGAEIFGYYASPQDSGGAEARATLTAGYGHPMTDSVNAWLSFDVLNTQGMKATARPFSNTSYLPSLGVDRTAAQSFPANVAIPGVGTKNPADPTPNAPNTVLSPVCLPPLSFPTIGSPHQCRYDGTPPSNILDPSTRYNVFGRLTWQINPDLLVFGEGSYTRNEFTTTTSETPADGLVLPASSPYYPAAWLQRNYPAVVGRPLTLSLRTVEIGPRVKNATSEQQRAVASLKATIKGWDFDAAFNYSRSKVSESFTDGWLDLRFVRLFQTGVINPFGPNTPAVLAQMDATTFNGEMQRATSTMQSIELNTSGDVMELSVGPLALALGGEYRKEDLVQWRAPIYESGQYVGAAASTIPTVPPTDRTVGSLFAEAYVPIVKNLDVQPAVRYDNYSDFGSTTNWKLALRWQPTRQVLFRGSWSTGFHAPSLLELYQPLFITGTLTTFSDPLRCPVTLSSNDCSKSFRLQRGGNPALLPETSKQWSLGIVLEPVDALSMSFDWFRIELQELLAQRSETFLGGAMSDPNSLYVHRGPIDPLYPTLPGPVEYLIGPTQNIGQKLVEGIDVDITARSPTSSLGMLTARLNGTYLAQYRQSQDDGSFPNIVGTRGDVGSIPRWKHVLTLDWTQGPWSATLIENYTQSYIETCLAGDSSGCTKRKVAAYEIWDLSGGYTGFANTTLRLGIKNIANREPPVSNQTLTGNIGYDPSYADPRGRTFYGSVRYAFR